MDTKYTRVVYGTAKVYLKEGWYPLEDLEAILKLAKERNERLSKIMRDNCKEVPE